MDILVRFLNSAKNSVSTPYVNSVFMRKATVTDVLENLEVASKGLNKNKFIQVSSGPNVNLKFLELLAGKPKYDSLNELISICTRTFDTVIRAFQNAENSTIWNIKNYYVWCKVFNKSSSRRVDSEKTSSATKEDYPLFFFCSTCCWWRTQKIVFKKTQYIWPKF